MADSDALQTAAAAAAAVNNRQRVPSGKRHMGGQAERLPKRRRASNAPKTSPSSRKTTTSAIRVGGGDTSLETASDLLSSEAVHLHEFAGMLRRLALPSLVGAADVATATAAAVLPLPQQQQQLQQQQPQQALPTTALKTVTIRLVDAVERLEALRNERREVIATYRRKSSSVNLHIHSLERLIHSLWHDEITELLSLDKLAQHTADQLGPRLPNLTRERLLELYVSCWRERKRADIGAERVAQITAVADDDDGSDRRNGPLTPAAALVMTVATTTTTTPTTRSASPPTLRSRRRTGGRGTTTTKRPQPSSSSSSSKRRRQCTAAGGVTTDGGGGGGRLQARPRGGYCNQPPQPTDFVGQDDPEDEDYDYEDEEDEVAEDGDITGLVSACVVGGCTDPKNTTPKPTMGGAAVGPKG